MPHLGLIQDTEQKHVSDPITRFSQSITFCFQLNSFFHFRSKRSREFASSRLSGSDVLPPAGGPAPLPGRSSPTPRFARFRSEQRESVMKDRSSRRDARRHRDTLNLDQVVERTRSRGSLAPPTGRGSARSRCCKQLLLLSQQLVLTPVQMKVTDSV
ncbi:hypothetical protein F2P81_000006 [Scophthalmus maximus]|uniref:Uncharacterized protein n=1 Tax=Scophthalmus maximus TaxID=52904 RepID=A0A6A4TJZ4_SCOMX|nr:hypothetical protein F2P81_000006 [Scophthalmus maximus]